MYRLLALLRDEGPLSRADLADRLAVPRARLHAELSRQAAAGRIVHAGPAPSRGGRRSTLVDLAPELCWAGADLGATSARVAILDRRLEIVAETAEPVDLRDRPQAVVRRISELVAKLAGPARLAGVGLGLPGPVRFRDGVPVAPPFMPGWHGVAVRAQLTAELSCPVVVDNEVNMMAIGEGYRGVARSVADFLFVKLGGGIGCGVHLGGEVYRGNDGSAGDIGHIQVDPDGPMCVCGNVGCLEVVAGGAALVRDGGRRLGAVLAALVAFANPAMIVIGGRLARLGPPSLAEVRAAVYSRSPPLAAANLRIVVSELDGRAGLIGAGKLASDLVFRR